MKDITKTIKVKSIIKSIIEGLKIGANTKINIYKYHPKTWDQFNKLVKELIAKRGNNADLNDIDTSAITDMGYTFYSSNFNGDISGWDVSNVTNMTSMFEYANFNGDISKWDVSNVAGMSYMFRGSKFTGENGDISGWDVSNVKDAQRMFDDSPLEKNPPKWYNK